MPTHKSSSSIRIALCLLALTGAWLDSARCLGAGTPERKVAFYQDSMHPWVKSDQPSKCSICAMDLTPVYAGDQVAVAGEGLVVLKPDSVTVLNVQTADVKRRVLKRTLRVAGTLEANEEQKTIVSSPIAGRVQNLSVNSVGMKVDKGQMLVTLFSPQLVQRRAFLRSVGGEQSTLSKDLVPTSAGSDPYLGELLAPQGGVVLERFAYKGQYVMEGEKLFTIAEPSAMWFRFDVYETQVPWLEQGQKLSVRTASVPGKTFPAVISFIEPALNESTRTIKVRADIENPMVEVNGHSRRLLRFGEYAEATLRSEIPGLLVVPRAAVLFPDDQAYVYVDKGAGAYQRVRVELGRQGDDSWEVLGGVSEGERVVISGNVLLDAQSQFASGHARGRLEGGAGGSEDGEKEGMSERERMPSGPALENPIQTVPIVRLDTAAKRALTDFLALADGLSQVLADDSLEQFVQRGRALPGVVSNLNQRLGPAHPWHPLLMRLEGVSHWAVPADLAAARKSFLPFSSEVVALVKVVHRQEKSLAGLKIFHCPMAPQPGLWFQAKGPLRNPFFGEKMLACGEDVAFEESIPNEVAPKEMAENVMPPVNGGMSAPAVSPPAGQGRTHHRTPAVARTQVPPPEMQGGGAGMGGMAEVAPEAVAGSEKTPALPLKTIETSNRPPVAATKRVFRDGRTSIMGAIMSPGSELQSMRRASILAGLAQDAKAGATNQTADPMTAVKRLKSGVTLTGLQEQSLKGLVEVTEGLTRVLAEDNMGGFFKLASVLPTQFTLIRDGFETNHPWSGMIQEILRTGVPVARMGDWPSTRTLEGARGLFQEFSGSMSNLAKELRKNDPDFAGLKIYQYSLDSSTNRWIQAAGPLRNPFTGVRLAASGAEVLD